MAGGAAVGTISRMDWTAVRRGLPAVAIFSYQHLIWKVKICKLGKVDLASIYIVQRKLASQDKNGPRAV